MDTLKNLLPAYAKDLRVNLGNVVERSSLGDETLWGTLLVSAIASRNPAVLEAIAAEASTRLRPEIEDAARAAAAIMAMNNVYYRSLHLIDSDEYAKRPARLRMQAIGRHGADKLDFELWCLAASAVNGCGACLDSHEKVLRNGGASSDAIHEALRIASVIHAVAVTIETAAPTSETRAA